MTRRSSTRAIVLQTFDVGEADRFCVLFTEKHGKMAARARAVRRPGSSMGGSLLPLRIVMVETVEHRNGAIITGARGDHVHIPPGNIPAFLQATQGMELLCMLLHESEPLPEVFSCAELFLRRCSAGESECILPFMLRLLTLLGLLPSAHDPLFQDLSTTERKALEAICAGAPAAPDTFAPHTTLCLMRLCERMVTDQTGRRQRAREVALAMQ